jgi:hypothetical protein
MMPLGFRHVKNFFELLFGSVFCGILSAAHFDKEVSKLSLFGNEPMLYRYGTVRGHGLVVELHLAWFLSFW